MRASRRIAVLIILMTTIAAAVGGTSIWVLYRAVMDEQAERLLDFATREALEVEAAVSANASADGARVHLSDLSDIGDTIARPLAWTRADDVAVGRRVAGTVEAVIFGSRTGPPRKRAIDAEAALSVPMLRALAGERGTLTGRDDSGADVLIAYAPVPLLGLGIVTRLNLARLRAPFERAASVALVLGIVLVACGTTAFLGISEPMVQHVQASEQRFRELFDHMPTAVFLFRGDAEGRLAVADLNRAAEAMEGVAREQAIGRPMAEIFVGESFQTVRDGVAAAAGRGETVHLSPIPHNDRPVRGWREYLIHPLARGEVAVMVDDVTERKATEEHLRQAQKMEVIGQLTGGLAHDFNNLLGIIIGNLELLEEQRTSPMPAQDLVSDALWSARRGSELVDRLLAFARRHPLHPQVVDLGQMLRGMTDFLVRTMGRNCEVRVELDGDLSPVLVDRGQLESALVNLIINARDAMPDGGTLTLSARNHHREESETSNEPGADDFVEFAVADSGTGMTEAVQGRIFEPFFTTKPAGKGSGLGLSMVYGFIKQSGGHIDVQTAPDRGTTIRLFLPKAEGAPIADDDQQPPVDRTASVMIPSRSGGDERSS